MKVVVICRRCNSSQCVCPPAEPPSDEDVRAALVEVIRKHCPFSTDVADAILADPLLGRLLRGGR